MTASYRHFLTAEALAALDASGYPGGSTPDTDLSVIAGILMARGAKRIVQLGTYHGVGSVVLAAVARQNDPAGGRVLNIDVGDLGAARGLCEAAGLAEYSEWLMTSSTAPDALARWAEGWDALYIDTSHEYEQTAEELRLYTPGAAAGTVILLHDAASEAARREPHIGVGRAVRDFLAANSAEWDGMIFESPAFGSWGVGCLVKKG